LLQGVDHGLVLPAADPPRLLAHRALGPDRAGWTGRGPIDLQRHARFDYDIADQAIRWVRNQKAVAPDRPFFLYYAPGATHSPHHSRKEWIAKYQGRFDQGWDRVREETLARQKQLGIVPADTQLTPRHEGIPAWDSLDAERRQLFAYMMEVYAGHLEQTDHNVGRVLSAHRQARPARQHAGRIHRR
jgi:arylsulfatase A-like enzyme